MRHLVSVNKSDDAIGIDRHSDTFEPCQNQSQIITFAKFGYNRFDLSKPSNRLCQNLKS